MEDFLFYIGKTSVAAGAFYLAYLLLFHKQKHFSFNRIYLPVSMLVSFLIPLITFTSVNYVELVAQESYSPTISYITSTPVEYVAPAFEFQWYHYLFGMYILGVAGFLLHLLIGHLKAMHIIRTSKIQQLFNHIINITKKDVHPFSFFNKIVLSEKILSSSNLEMIVTHEKIHVREKHTFDILIAEFLFVLQWFNPFAWLMKGEVRNNLEYKTDDEIAKTYDPQKYQLAMVALADKKEVAPFLTALNGSQLKNRIMMMKQKTENKFRVARQLIVLPLLAVLVMGLSNKEVKNEFISANQTEIDYSSPKKYSIADIEISGSKNFDKSILLEMSGLKIGQKIEMPGNEIKSAISNLYDQGPFSDVKISASNIIDDNIWLDIYLEEKQSQPNSNVHQNRIIKGKVADINGNPLAGATVLVKDKNTGTVTNTEGNYAIETNEDGERLSFHMKGYKSKEIITEDKEEVNVVLEENEDRIIRGKITDKSGNPLVQVNVVEYDKPGGRAISGTVTDTKGVYIIEFESNHETLYFSKKGFKSKEVNVAGNDTINVELEVAYFKTEQIGIGNNEKGSSGIFNSTKADPLILVDGKIAIDLQSINPAEIASLTVLKNEDALKLYGGLGKNGVILITTNNANQKEIQGDFDWSARGDLKGVVTPNENMMITSANDNGLNFRIRQTGDSKEQPLVLVDGVPHKTNLDNDFDYATANIEDFGELINVAPENIESIEVLKDAASIAIYGDQAKNGVLLIKTKKKEGAINSIQELRNFIAREIRFPETTRGMNRGSTAFDFFAKMNKKSGDFEIVGRPESGEEIIDAGEIIVTALRDENMERETMNNSRKLFMNEINRVLGKLQINIPEIEDKNVKLDIKFVLEDDKSGIFDSDNITVPQGFSPNGDGVHDVFEVNGLEKKYPNFKMKILNNAGDLIWEYKHNGNANSMPNWWDGKDNSNDVKKGNYYYTIEFNDGLAKTQSGHFILVE